jgi:hypothetical protein
MTEERAEKGSYSEHSVSGLLDQFIDAQFEAQEARRRVEIYRTSHLQAPTPPDRFADVRELANYASAQVRHEQTLDQLNKDQQEAEQRMKDAQGRVAALLPLGSTVVHAYEGAHPEEFTGQCEITHDPATAHDPRLPAEVPYIRVRWLRG